MKQNNLISIAALVGVVVLFVLHFTSNNGNTASNDQPSTADSTSTVKKQPTATSDAIVAFVNTDTVLKYYTRAIQYREELQADKIKLESEIGREEKGLLGEAQLYQSQAANMSQFERYQKERDLTEKEQNLMQKQERYSRQFAQKEANLTIRLNEVVQDYIERYCEDKSYRMVIGHQELGGALLWGSADLDITQDVLDGLNEEYSTTTDK